MREGLAGKNFSICFLRFSPTVVSFIFLILIITMASILCLSLRDGICTVSFTTKLYNNERKRGDREVTSDATVSEKILLYKLMYDSLYITQLKILTSSFAVSMYTRNYIVIYMFMLFSHLISIKPTWKS